MVDRTLKSNYYYSFGEYISSFFTASMLVPFNSSHSTFASVFSQPFFPLSPVFIFGIQACGRTRTGSLVFRRIN